MKIHTNIRDAKSMEQIEAQAEKRRVAAMLEKENEVAKDEAPETPQKTGKKKNQKAV